MAVRLQGTRRASALDMAPRARHDIHRIGRLMVAVALLAPLGVLAVAWAPARDVDVLAMPSAARSRGRPHSRRRSA